MDNLFKEMGLPDEEYKKIPIFYWNIQKLENRKSNYITPLFSSSAHQTRKIKPKVLYKKISLMF